MPEVIPVFVGQAGIQIGQEFWKQTLFEEGIDFNGQQTVDREIQHSIHFEENHDRWTPRCLFVDSEPTVAEEVIHTGELSRLLTREYAVTGNDSASDSYARGYFHCYKLLRANIINKMRRICERCTFLGCVNTANAICGGTGSGLTTAMVSDFKDVIDAKITIGSHAIFPSKNYCDVITEPYNAVLCMAQSKQLYNLRLVYDNETIGGIVDPLLTKYENRSCTFSDINHLVGLVLSGMSAGNRFRSPGGASDINRLQTNLVPFPKINLVSAAICPLWHHSSNRLISADTVTCEALFEQNELSGIDTLRPGGKYIAVSLFYRSKEVRINNCDYKISSKIPFVGWVPCGIEHTVCREPMRHHTEHVHYIQPHLSLLKITNHTTMSSQIISHILTKYSGLLGKRCYLSWYINEGMEEGEFAEAEEEIANELNYVKHMVSESVAE